ncbi:hypothetical protein BDW22DRAFT_1433195 [Trametopsis cervina]|nr:hypothetical protein BDW22DRAFT_1433195 [Trametopsis cervina]
MLHTRRSPYDEHICTALLFPQDGPSGFLDKPCGHTLAIWISPPPPANRTHALQIMPSQLRPAGCTELTIYIIQDDVRCMVNIGSPCGITITLDGHVYSGMLVPATTVPLMFITPGIASLQRKVLAYPDLKCSEPTWITSFSYDDLDFAQDIVFLLVPQTAANEQALTPQLDALTVDSRSITPNSVPCEPHLDPEEQRDTEVSDNSAPELPVKQPVNVDRAR